MKKRKPTPMLARTESKLGTVSTPSLVTWELVGTLPVDELVDVMEVIVICTWEDDDVDGGGVGGADGGDSDGMDGVGGVDGGDSDGMDGVGGVEGGDSGGMDGGAGGVDRDGAGTDGCGCVSDSDNDDGGTSEGTLEPPHV